MREQLRQAAEAIPEVDPGATVRVLDRFVKSRIDGLPEEASLPPETKLDSRAGTLSGPALQAARAFAGGDAEGALKLLQGDELEADPDAAHLRALIHDQTRPGARPFDRLETIADYRYALSLDGDTAMAERARVRVGQIFLELGFFPEARAALHPWMGDRLRPPYARAARVSHAEASYLDGDAKQTIETILTFDLGTLPPGLRRWAIRRTADSLYRLQTFSAAIRAYQRLSRESPEPGGPDPLARLRLGLSLLQAGRPAEALLELRPLRAEGTPEPLGALGQLLAARAQRETKASDDAVRTAAGLVEQRLDPKLAALAAVELLESQSLAGTADPDPPPGSLALMKQASQGREFGLLAYRMLASPRQEEARATTRRKLGRLLRRVSNPTLKTLIREDLTARLQEHLRQVQLGTEKPDPQVVEDVGRYLRPGQIGEDARLLALEAFFAGQDWDRCMRWGRVLYRNEVRPMRKGLGAWREVRCRQEKGPKLVSAGNLLLLAENGKVGSFALALSALAAEHMIRDGRVDRALRTYERALEAVAEPRLLGPVLLRTGELEVAHGPARLGVQHLLRGLSLTGNDATAGDPFRKAGMVVLARAIEGARSHEARDFAALLARERERAEDWWKPVYAYLGFRSGQVAPSGGTDLFSRGAAQIRETDRLAKRVEEVVGEKPLAAAGEKVARK